MSDSRCLPDEFRLELNRRGYHNTYKALLANVINSSLLAVALWPFISDSLLIIWLAFVLVVCIVRAQIVRIFKSADQENQSHYKWHVFMVLGQFSGACIWAYPSIFLFPEDNESVQVFIAFLVGGMAAGSLTSLSHSKLSLHLFLVTAIAPLFLRFIFLESPFSNYMAFMIFLGYGMTLLSGLKVHEDLLNLINLQLKNSEQEQVISQSELKYTSIVDQAADAFFLVNHNGMIEETNSQACRDLGCSKTDLIGRDIRDIFQQEKLYEMINTGKPLEALLHFPATNIRERQSYAPVDLTVGSIVLHNTNYYSIFVRDNSERHEQQLILQQAKAKIDVFLKKTPLGYVVTDTLGKVVEWNPAAERIFGYTREEMLDKDPQEVLLDEKNKTIVQERLKGKLDHMSDKSLVNENIHRNGNMIVCEWFNTPIADSQNNLMGIVSFIQEITQSIEDEKELVKAKADAEKANKAKSEFLSRMSHELRTPMNAIMGFNQLLELSNSLIEEDRDSVEEIKRASEHLLKLINEVLELSKIEAGKMSVSIEPVNVKCIADECVRLVSPLTEKNAITLHLELPENQFVMADQLRLKQGLLNLLSNAIKYNCRNGEVTLSVALTDGNNRVKISVKDTGIGIPQTHQEQLFTPFSRLGNDSTLTDGTGIGLTITRKFVQLMGGNIGFESTENVGSVFWIELPNVVEHPMVKRDENTPSVPLNVDDAAGNDNNAIVVLYIDDNPSNVRLVERLLSRFDELVLLSAHDPHTGIELAVMSHPKLILLDITMPEMDGYQVLKVLQDTPETATVPCVAVTANALPGDVEKGLAAGFDDYLTKPLDVNKFCGVVERFALDKNELESTPQPDA